MNNKENSKILYKVLMALICIAIFPYQAVHTTETGLDASWALSINFALKNKLIWGKDYFFTYGPLGYFFTGLDIYVSKIFIWFFYIFLWINCCAVLIFIFPHIKILQPFQAYAFSCLLLFSSYDFIIKDPSSTMLILSVFLILHSLNYNRIISAVAASIYGSIMLFCKLDTGIIINILTIGFCIYQIAISKKFQYGILLFGIISCIAILTHVLKVALSDYLQTGFILINYYNDAMFLKNEWWKIIPPILLFTTIFLFTIKNRLIILSQRNNFITVTLILLCLFVLYKHGYVRHGGELFILPAYGPLTEALLFIFCKNYNLRLIKQSFLLLILLSFLFKSKQIIEDINSKTPFAYNLKLNSLNFVYKRLFKKEYHPPLSKLMGYDPTKPPPVKLSSDKIKMIGSSFVDAVPFLASNLIFNELNYLPRPGVQSYSNYHELLDKKAADKYNSTKGPEFIFYCADNSKIFSATIDDRYPFFDETKTKLEMMRNYVVIDQYGKDLILKRNKSPKSIHVFKKIKNIIQLNSEFNIPSSEYLHFVKINVNYSLLGKLLRILYQPPELRIIITPEGGKPTEFRAIKPILEGGVIINKYITDNTNAKYFINGQINKIKNIINIKLLGANWGFEDEIKLESIYLKVAYVDKAKQEISEFY